MSICNFNFFNSARELKFRIYFGIGLTLASIAAAVAYVAVAAVNGTTMNNFNIDNIGDNLYLAAIMALLVTKWSVSLAVFSRKFRILYGETEADVLV